MRRRTLSLHVNDTFTSELESHEGGGYLWTIASNDEAVTQVRIMPRESTQCATAPPIGKSLPVRVEITALAEGKSVVVLEEKRSWETGVKPLNVYRINITVKQKY